MPVPRESHHSPRDLPSNLAPIGDPRLALPRLQRVAAKSSRLCLELLHQAIHPLEQEWATAGSAECFLRWPGWGVRQHSSALVEGEGNNAANLGRTH